MKPGMTVTELAGELQVQQSRKRDLVLDTRLLTMLTRRDDDGAGAGTEVEIPDETTMVPSDRFHRQLGAHLGVDAKLYDRLAGRHPGLFDHLVNGLLRAEPKRRLIRCYTDGGGADGRDGIARAFLSDQYLRIDNLDLAQIALPIIGQVPGAVIDSCNLSESKMYLKVIVPALGRDLNDYRRGIDFDALRRQYGAHHFFTEDEAAWIPDLVQPGFVIENSEVGAGALRVSQLVFRVVCSNGAIVEHAVNRRHVGTRIGGDDDGAVWRDDTRAAIDEAIRLKVRDAIQSTVDLANFDLIARQFAEAGATKPMERPVEAVKVLARATALTDREGEDVLQFLLAGGDLTLFGAMNAITAAAQTRDDYDRSVEMEAIGGSLLGWSNRQWDAIAQVS